tara:strand:- start:533 stop:1618 length:1086 start_codon:yes stop_codon:yes gene_type:complete
MANMDIFTPRFYTDQINYLLSRGSAQNGNFDVLATDAGAYKIGLQTGTEAELFDMNPLNKVDFDTSGDTDGHVIITINTGGTVKVSYIAILNHNLATAVGKIRIFAGDESTDVTAVDGANADTGDIAWADDTVTEVVNGDTTTAASNDKSVVVEPASDGSTIVRFAEQSNRYWGIQFEGNTTNTGVATNGTWGSTDLFVGCICIGEIYEMPHSPDLSVTRTIAFDKVNVQESIGGNRYSNMVSSGRTATSTTSSPFSVASEQGHIHGGRISYDLSWSYLASSDLMPAEYDSTSSTDDSVVTDIWNKTNGPHIPFIFSCDKDSEGNDAESEHIFARFAQDSLSMQQVAYKLWSINFKIDEEF